MSNSTGASQFPALLESCVLWFTGMHCAGVSGDIDEFPIIPSGVTITNNGTFYKTDLGNNKQVVNFDGSTNYISLSDSDAWNFGTGDFTIAFWVKRTQLGAYERLVQQMVDSSNRWTIYWDNSLSFINFYAILSGISKANYEISYEASSGLWRFVVFTRSDSTFNPYCYDTNGVSVISNITTNTAISTNEMPNLSIGLTIGGSDYPCNGNIKDLMIFKGRALTVPEIVLLMNRTHPITGKGLMVAPYSYWRLS